MKKIALISAIAISSLLYNTASAQIRLNFGIRFSPRPVYVPERVVVQQPVEYAEPANYDGDEDYYYLPDVDAYYSVPEQCYYYNDGDQWISAAYLPGAYRDYDWRSARRYEVRAPRPFMHNDYYRTRFNGVAFNGHWDRGYNHNYANESRFDRGQYRNDEQRFNNDGGRGGYSRQYDQNRDQHFDNSRGHFDNNRGQFDNNRGQDNRRNDHGRDHNMGSAQQHFAQNNFQGNDRGGRDSHRQARF